jgi:putative hemolysin
MNKSSLETLIKRINEMENRSIITIMTPLSNMIFIDENDSRDEMLKKIEKSKRTFYPVCNQGAENVVGIIHIKDLLIGALKNLEIDIKEGLHEPVYFNETNSILHVYNIFYQSNIGAAFVVNKSNNVIGFITLKDVTKAIMGNVFVNKN